MNTPSITFTQNALIQIEKLCHTHPEASGLLVTIKTTGCSGYAYDFSMIKEISADMEKIEPSNGVFMAYYKKDLPILEGSCLDYVKEGLSKHFKFLNPNEQGTCGCGESFYLK